jgi:hypothetical protein
MLDIICDAVCLSHATTTIIIIIAESCVNQFRNNAKELESLCSAMDDSNNMSNTAQLLEVI